jgi:pimeloyl-ACP methyl ester carboxylesterase
MPILDRNGVQIHYAVHGSGPAVLLTHGYSATSEMWKPQIAVLSQRYRVLLWDMRGHGQSDSPNDPAAYSEEATVGDMAALLDAFAVEQAVIGGLSLGGYMSLAFHLAHPERVKGLMLFDTGPGFRKDPPREAWNQRAEATARAFESKGLTALGRSAEVLASTHRSPQGLAHAARGMLAQRDARGIDSLPSIKVPTLVLAGAKDEPFLAATDYMASKIPGATKVVIPEAGHAANLDQPEAFNRAVLAFLQRVWA